MTDMLNQDDDLAGRFEEIMVSVGGISLHVIMAGPREGAAVILLHGFPEFWHGWIRQIVPLAEAGFRVIVPDQRGYNLSEKPRGLSGYRLDRLAQDVVDLMDALGVGKAAIVGHDWGGVVAWAVVALHPDRVKQLVVMDAPYPPVLLHTLWKHPEQLKKSSYILFFQLPLLPEAQFRKNNFETFVKLMRRTSPEGVFTAADFAAYRQAWQQKGALTAMLNWYRALLFRPFQLPRSVHLEMPVLLMWGGRDFALGVELAEESIKRCQNGRLIIFPQANHWVQHEESGEVVRLLLDFLKV